MEEENQNLAPRRSNSVALLIFPVFAIISVLFTIYGLYVAYSYKEGDKVVGGDAYNFIILGLRGLAWVCAGAVSAIFAAIFLLMWTHSDSRR